MFSDNTESIDADFGKNNKLKHNLLHDSNQGRKTRVESARLGILFVWICWLSIGVYRIGEQQQDDESCRNIRKWMTSTISIDFAAISYNSGMGFCYICLQNRHRRIELRETEVEESGEEEESVERRGIKTEHITLA